MLAEFAMTSAAFSTAPAAHRGRGPRLQGQLPAAGLPRRERPDRQGTDPPPGRTLVIAAAEITQRRGQAGGTGHRLVDVPAGPARQPGRRRARLRLLRSRGRPGLLSGYSRPVGLFGFLRKKDERAIPEPGTPEFEAAVQGTALPDCAERLDGGDGLDQPRFCEIREADRAELDDRPRATGAREEVEEALREHGIDPDKKGQTIDASSVPGLRKDRRHPRPDAAGFRTRAASEAGFRAEAGPARSDRPSGPAARRRQDHGRRVRGPEEEIAGRMTASP